MSTFPFNFFVKSNQSNRCLQYRSGPHRKMRRAHVQKNRSLRELDYQKGTLVVNEGNAASIPEGKPILTGREEDT